jgi:FMN reductase
MEPIRLGCALDSWSYHDHGVTMTAILAITGSPSPTSRTVGVVHWVADRLRQAGLDVEHLAVRDLPADDLLAARVDRPALRAAVAAITQADAVVVATPLYKASYTGLLKAFLDVLPQFALAGKSVLPLATGGTLAHVLAIDYALRPVLMSLGAHHVVQGFSSWTSS